MELLTILQIIFALLLTVGILMQSSSSGIEGAIGGGSSMENFSSTRRGFDAFSFQATIIFAFAFVAVSVLQIIL